MKDQEFFTDSNKKVPALTTAQMREVDRIAMQETGPNLGGLSPAVSEVLRLSRLLTVFDIYEDENQALLSSNPRVGREGNGAGRSNRGGGYIGA